MFTRLMGVRATVEIIAASLGQDRGIAGAAAEALEGVRAELNFIACDLDVGAWHELEAKEAAS
jgi:hypothetical protein